MAAEFEIDALVWVSCPEAVWRPGRVVAGPGVRIAVPVAGGDEGEEEVIDVDGPQPAQGVLISPRKPAPRRVLRRNAVLVGDGALRFDDLTDVPELHEAAVLHALNVRFCKGVIYTSTGPVLLAVNPFRSLPGLYSPETLRSFFPAVGSAAASQKAKRPPPHVFGVAARALRGICERCESQTVLISGESGAGKTETTKFVMQFLALAGAEGDAGATPGSSRSRGGNAGGMSKVERQVLGSNPLLEAFGNAKTLRNDNSSRFGKYIELQFGVDQPGWSESARLVGARIRTYLLEKVRVLHQQEGERTFHIFYQALAAANSPTRLMTAGLPFRPVVPNQTLEMSKGGLSLPLADVEGDVDVLEGFLGYPATSFSYLENSANTALHNCDEAEEFESTLSAMRAVGINSEASDVLGMVAAVLHLGNLHFTEPHSEASQVSLPEGVTPDDLPGGRAPLQVVCSLLGVEERALTEALCSRTMQAPGEERLLRIPNTTQRAADSRDALARHLYGALFDHVVRRTNESIGFREHATFCGVLDIFGFEFFQTNSFEQLCINYTNELLQQYFNEFIFENEAALYREEGIAWEPEDFPDNAPIVALLHERVRGVLPMLEEECFSIGGSSERWGSKLIKEHEGHHNFSIIRNKQGVFVLRHFAGPVTYTVDGFLEKNKDELSTDILACMRGSRRPFVSARFSERDRVFGSGPRRGAPGEAAAGAPDPSSPRAPGAGERVLRAKRYTVSSEFREQLHELLGQIHLTVPHFVRCIKPNSKNRPFEEAKGDAEPRPLFNRAQVAEQLSYQGVLEAVRVARAGYPVRFAHEDFYMEFGCLVCPKLRAHLEAEVKAAGEFTAAAAQQMLESGEMQAVLSPEAEPVRRGWALGRTRVFLKQEPSNALRAALGRARHAAATRLQAAARRCAAARRYARFSWALRRLQARWRGAAVRGEMWREKRETAATMLAAAARTLRARQRFHTARRAVLTAQAWGRMRWCRKRYLADRARLTQLQRWWRSLQKRRRWRNLQQNMLRIQRCWRGSRGRLQARELKVRRHRLKVAVRSLLRMRRRNLAQRAWRADMMSYYLRREPVPAPSRQQALRDINELRVEYEAMYKELQSFRAERAEWDRRVEALRNQAWTRVRGMFTSEPIAETRPSPAAQNLD